MKRAREELDERELFCPRLMIKKQSTLAFSYSHTIEALVSSGRRSLGATSTGMSPGGQSWRVNY